MVLRRALRTEDGRINKKHKERVQLLLFRTLRGYRIKKIMDKKYAQNSVIKSELNRHVKLIV